MEIKIHVSEMILSKAVQDGKAKKSEKIGKREETNVREVIDRCFVKLSASNSGVWDSRYSSASNSCIHFTCQAVEI
jgi:hypothetical protein